MDGMDRGWAWAVAFAACMINFIMAGMSRMSGILFVSFIEMYQVDRKGASTPFSVRSSMWNLFGPAVGILGQKYGIQKMIILGTIISSISTTLCFFATDIVWITVLWGGLGGIGSALTTSIIQVVIGQYFKKYRTTAAGMGFSGGCVGAFLFPVLIEQLLLNYGIEGTFLIISGIIMHTIAAAIILKKPPWLKKNYQKKQAVNPTLAVSSSTNELVKLEDGVKITKINDLTFGLHGDISIKHSENYPNILLLQEHSKLVIRLLTMKTPDDNSTSIPQEKYQKNYSINEASPVIETCILETMEDMYYSLQQSHKKYQSKQNVKLSKTTILHDMLQRNDIKYICSQKSRSFHLGKKLKISSNSTIKPNSVPDVSKISNEISLNYVLFKMRGLFGMEINRILSENPEISRDEVLKVLTELRKLYRMSVHFHNAENENYLTMCWDIPEEAVSSGNTTLKEDSAHPNTIWVHIMTAVKLYRNPLFLLICLCRTVHFITFVPVVTTIVDFAIDKGLKEEDGKYVIAALSLGDLLGRLCLGWVTDKGFMTLPKYMMVGMVFQGSNMASLPLMHTKFAIFLCMCLFGLIQGSLFIRHSVLVLKYMEPREQSIAMGCINLFSGFLGFALPIYIGYFRDTLGTYDYIFYINGAMCAIIGLLWVFEPHFLRCHSLGRTEEKHGTA